MRLASSRDCIRRERRGDLGDQRFHAAAGIYVGIHIRMPLTVGVHDEHPRVLVIFLDHVGQVMAIVPGKGLSQDDQVERRFPHSFFHALAADSRLNFVTGFLDHDGLRGKHFFVEFPVKNLELEWRF